MGKSFSIVMQQNKALKRALDKTVPATIMKRTISDARSRVPGWVAKEVTAHYAIEPETIQKKSRIRVRNVSSSGIEVAYKGRVLSAASFNMQPREPMGEYVLRAEIKRGEVKTLGKVKKMTKKQQYKLAKNFTREGTRTSPESPWMIMRMPYRDKEGNVLGHNYLPMQRRGYGKSGKLHAFRTLSVPQMIDNKEVHPAIDAVIGEKMGKRIEHHMELMYK